MPFGVLFLDVDNFKAINDTFGHEAGDKALMLLADAVKSHLRDGELGARYRGDEYCIILPGRGASEAAAAAEERVMSCEPATLRRGYLPTL